MGFLDLLDKLLGNPGWHRDHRKAWLGFTTPGTDGLTRLQQELRNRLAESLQLSGQATGEWKSLESQPPRTIHSDVLGTGFRVWLDPDSAAFGQRLRRGEIVPDRVYEEWDFRTPADLVALFLQDLMAALPRSGD